MIDSSVSLLGGLSFQYFLCLVSSRTTSQRSWILNSNVSNVFIIESSLSALQSLIFAFLKFPATENWMRTETSTASARKRNTKGKVFQVFKEWNRQILLIKLLCLIIRFGDEEDYGMKIEKSRVWGMIPMKKNIVMWQWRESEAVRQHRFILLQLVANGWRHTITD